jgi:hypothetical protein
MNIFKYTLLYIVLSFITGVLIITFFSSEKVSSYSIFEIARYGFYALSFIVIIITAVVLTFTV